MQLSLDYICIWAAYYSLPSSFRGVQDRNIETEKSSREQRETDTGTETEKTEYTETFTGTETEKTEYTETSNVIRESLGDRVKWMRLW